MDLLAHLNIKTNVWALVIGTQVSSGQVTPVSPPPPPAPTCAATSPTSSPAPWLHNTTSIHSLQPQLAGWLNLDHTKLLQHRTCTARKPSSTAKGKIRSKSEPNPQE